MWDRLKALGFEKYDDYLNSPHWKQFRQRYVQAGNNLICVVCGTMQRIQLHHVTYERLGCERFSDVRPLCEPHHHQVHACLKADKQTVKSTDAAVARIKAGETFDTSDLMSQWAKQWGKGEKVQKPTPKVKKKSPRKPRGKRVGKKILHKSREKTLLILTLLMEHLAGHMTLTDQKVENYIYDATAKAICRVLQEKRKPDAPPVNWIS